MVIEMCVCCFDMAGAVRFVFNVLMGLGWLGCV